MGVGVGIFAACWCFLFFKITLHAAAATHTDIPTQPDNDNTTTKKPQVGGHAGAHRAAWGGRHQGATARPRQKGQDGVGPAVAAAALREAD